jgi:hypothetical protein
VKKVTIEPIDAFLLRAVRQTGTDRWYVSGVTSAGTTHPIVDGLTAEQAIRLERWSYELVQAIKSGKPWPGSAREWITPKR